MKIKTLKEALERIAELEKEVEQLKKENKKLLARNFGGRKKHDEAWIAAYNDFATKLENGMTVSEIAADSEISTRTAYRYLAYYRELQKVPGDSKGVRK